ncbi:phospholipase-like protein [Tanacetum coccineum]
MAATTSTRSVGRRWFSGVRMWLAAMKVVVVRYRIWNERDGGYGELRFDDEDDKKGNTKTYSIEGFAWAFKTWILESFRAATGEYYTRYRRHPRIVVWSSKHKFYRHMLKPMLHGQLPVERLVPDETELDRNGGFQVGHTLTGVEQRRGYQEMKEKNDDMYEKMTRLMEDMRRVPEANTTPIIVDQHFGVSDISGFQSYQGVPSSFHTLANNISFFNMATPLNCQTPNQSNWFSLLNWQTPNPLYLGTPNSQPPIPSQPGTSNWQNLMTSYSPNLPPPIPSRRQDARILDPNLCDRARREPQPSVYMLSPYTVLPPTTVLTKKRIDKTKKKAKTKKLSPLNLGNTFADENVSGDDVTITDCYMKGYKLPSFFWPQLVPHLCTYRRERSWPEGWLSSDILIRERTENANWTLAKSGTVCLHQENNRFMILTDPHNIGTLDGSVHPFPSWNDVTWVYMPINAGGVHWVTGAINLAASIFYVFDSMESETRMLMLEQQVRDWSPVINRILEMRGYFNGTGRQPYNFRFSYNELFGYKVPQQKNAKDCGVITCWLITKLCLGQAPTMVDDSQVYWDNMRYYMCNTFYKCRCEDTEYCGY